MEAGIGIHAMQFGLKHVAERAAAQPARAFDGGARALEVLDVGRGLVIGWADARQTRAQARIVVLCVHLSQQVKNIRYYSLSSSKSRSEKVYEL